MANPLRIFPIAFVAATVVALALLLLVESTAHAGADCEPGEGWSLLGKLARGKISAADLGPGNNDVDLCLLGPRSYTPSQHHWYRKWPKVKAHATSEDGKKIAKLCAPAFAAPKRTLAKELCVALLAGEGVGEIAGQRTLELGRTIYSCGFPIKHLAGLRGAEVAREAEGQWDQDEQTFCGYGGCSCQRAPKATSKPKRMRRRAAFLRDHKLDVLNALSYVGDAESISWLETVASKDADTKVRERAEKVLALLRHEAPQP
jgi:hypothetical protein